MTATWLSRGSGAPTTCAYQKIVDPNSGRSPQCLCPALRVCAQLGSLQPGPQPQLNKPASLEPTVDPTQQRTRRNRLLWSYYFCWHFVLTSKTVERGVSLRPRNWVHRLRSVRFLPLGGNCSSERRIGGILIPHSREVKRKPTSTLKWKRRRTAILGKVDVGFRLTSRECGIKMPPISPLRRAVPPRGQETHTPEAMDPIPGTSETPRSTVFEVKTKCQQK